MARAKVTMPVPATRNEVSLNGPKVAKRISSTAWLRGLELAIVKITCTPASRSFHSG